MTMTPKWTICLMLLAGGLLVGCAKKPEVAPNSTAGEVVEDAIDLALQRAERAKIAGTGEAAPGKWHQGFQVHRSLHFQAAHWADAAAKHLGMGGTLRSVNERGLLLCCSGLE